MQKVFTCANAAQLEKLAKEAFSLPPFLMMENAAGAMADFLENSGNTGKTSSILIVCGKGNNGGDGYALARLLQDKMKVTLAALEVPAAEEAKVQCEICRRLGVEILSPSDTPGFETDFQKLCQTLTTDDFIADCIYGTGFHGSLSPDMQKIIDLMNKSPAQKLACDIPSALEFSADYTITMGCQKQALYSDKAKAVSGQIMVADLGITREKFEGFGKTDLYLIEAADRELPLRKNRALHKGKLGHTAVLCGDKAGAAILAASAAMNFGSGLTSLVKTSASNLEQFKLSPSLMISDSIPKKASCLLAGSGFSDFSEEAASLLINWFKAVKSPAVLLDAGMITSSESPALLETLNSFEDARIVLTPHLSELSRLLEACKAEGDISVAALAENPDAKVAAGKFLTERFPHTTVIMKSANTFIASSGETYIIADGAQSLAKGGSGDLLAGMTASLLAQGYTASQAAITAAEHHALLSQKLGREAYNLTPEKLISLL
jgi:hydroxyethylthiazole kinase-like uncharacterized protein yjeF